MVQDIECELDMAEDYAKKAIQYKIDYQYIIIFQLFYITYIFS